MPSPATTHPPLITALKIVTELLEKASELLTHAAEGADAPLGNEAARQAVREELARIRLNMSMLSRHATVLRALANRRKPPKRQAPGLRPLA